MILSGLTCQMNGVACSGVAPGAEAGDGGQQIVKRAEPAVVQPSPGQLGEDPLDGVQPTACGRDEMAGPVRVALQPFFDLAVLVGATIALDRMDDIARRDARPGPVQEAQEFLMAMPLHILPDPRAVQHIVGSPHQGARDPQVKRSTIFLCASRLNRRAKSKRESEFGLLCSVKSTRSHSRKPTSGRFCLCVSDQS